MCNVYIGQLSHTDNNMFLWLVLISEIYQHSHLAGGAVSMGATIKSSPIRPAIPVNVTSSERKQACLFIKHFRKIGMTQIFIVRISCFE